MTPSRERTLTREQVRKRLWQMTAKQFGKEADALRPEDRLLQDLGADSLDAAELTMEVEEQLDVVLPNEVLENQNVTLGELEEAVWARYSQGT